MFGSIGAVNETSGLEGLEVVTGGLGPETGGLGRP